MREETYIRLARWAGEIAIIKALNQSENPWTRLLGQAFRAHPYPGGTTHQGAVIPGGVRAFRDTVLLGKALVMLILEASDFHTWVNHPDDIEVREVWREEGVAANRIHLRLVYRGSDDELVELARGPEGWVQKAVDAPTYLDAWNPDFRLRWEPV